MNEIYKYIYKTPSNFSNLIIISDGKFIKNIHFEDGKEDNFYYIDRDLSIFKEISLWLDSYFKGENPERFTKYKLENISKFQEEVLDILKDVKYGEVITYGEIGKIISKRRGIKRMSAEAVGHALKNNPLCIIFPCHRVIGKNNKLIGYNGGLQNKIELLKLEGIDIKNYKK